MGTNPKVKKDNSENLDNQNAKFVVTKDEFLKPYRMRVQMNEMISENLAKQGMSEESINDYLQMIDEE